MTAVPAPMADQEFIRRTAPELLRSKFQCRSPRLRETVLLGQHVIEPLLISRSSARQGRSAANRSKAGGYQQRMCWRSGHVEGGRKRITCHGGRRAAQFHETQMTLGDFRSGARSSCDRPRADASGGGWLQSLLARHEYCQVVAETMRCRDTAQAGAAKHRDKGVSE